MRNLSQAQFSEVAPPQPLGVEPQAPPETPLPYSDLTNTSAKQAAAWRPPSKAMPLSQATNGSVFRPYQPDTSAGF